MGRALFAEDQDENKGRILLANDGSRCQETLPVVSCVPSTARANILDRVPITPLSRPELPFQTIFIDCIGPLDPPSARGHRYALCIVDLCMRWAEVVCLRSLTAQATCDALVGVLARFGTPQLICSDQGTNFVAKLTRLLTERLGVEMRFSTPDHPQSNGLVERWNGTFKAMLRHVIQDHGGQWDK